MSINQPLISIIVPAYNLERYIGETLESILAQEGYSNFEVLVVDDRSQDQTRAIVSRYANSDNRVRIFNNQRSQGAAGARNYGIEQAKGEWIAFLDGDDLWERDNLASKIAVLETFPDVQLITSDFYNENATHSPVPKSQLSRTRQSMRASWKKHVSQANENNELKRLDGLVKIFIEDDVIGKTGVFLIRRDLIHKCGFFDESMMICEDVDLWLRLANCIDYLVYVPKPLMFYRYREGSLTNQNYFAHANYVIIFLKKLLHVNEFKPYRGSLKKRISSRICQRTYYLRKQGYKIKAIASAIEGVSYGWKTVESWKNLFIVILLM